MSRPDYDSSSPHPRRFLLLYGGSGVVILLLLGVVVALRSQGSGAEPPPTTLPPGHGAVRGCNTYGENCDGNPIYRDVPPPDYDWPTWPKITTVVNGTVLQASCWDIGGMTWNYAAKAIPPDHGPDPYASDVYFYVLAPSGDWGWIPDTYFVRDQGGRMGLPKCAGKQGPA